MCQFVSQMLQLYAYQWSAPFKIGQVSHYPILSHELSLSTTTSALPRSLQSINKRKKNVQCCQHKNIYSSVSYCFNYFVKPQYFIYENTLLMATLLPGKHNKSPTTSFVLPCCTLFSFKGTCTSDDFIERELELNQTHLFAIDNRVNKYINRNILWDWWLKRHTLRIADKLT
jgi:hypothetical protein